MEEDSPATEASKGKILSNEELEKEEDDRIIAAAANDPRFQQLTNRRILRFSYIIERGKEAMDMQSGEKVYDFSDEAKDQVQVGSKWIQCLKGDYVL